MLPWVINREMASNRTVDERREEARKAAEILRCSVRHCLNLPDAHLSVEKENLYKVVEVIKKWRPGIVLAPYFRDDRHPDHNAAGELVKRAVFLAGLKRLPLTEKPFRPEKLYFFLLSVERAPDLIVDISDVYETKEESIKAHQSQFSFHCSDRVPTIVNDPFFKDLFAAGTVTSAP
jgi:bacillithiol biosynthesis deacetylase BshB1